MSDVALREALAKAHQPVTMTFGERWHLTLVVQEALESEMRKLTGQIARAKHQTTKRVLTARLSGVLTTLEAVKSARKES